MTTTKPLLTVATMMKVTRRFTCRPFRAWPAFANAALLFIYHLVVVYVDFLSLSKLTTKCPKKVKLNMGTNSDTVDTHTHTQAERQEVVDIAH